MGTPLQKINDSEPQIGSVESVARILGMSTSTLNKLRIYRPRDSPPFYYVGRRAYYPLKGEQSLESWIAARTSDPKHGRRL